MFLGIKDSSQLEFKFGNNILKPTNFVKLLGVTIDCKLNFDQHIAALCSTASKKVKALFRIRSFLDINCAKRLMDSYICLLYTSPSPRDKRQSRMPSSA